MTNRDALRNRLDDVAGAFDVDTETVVVIGDSSDVEGTADLVIGGDTDA